MVIVRKIKALSFMVAALAAGSSAHAEIVSKGVVASPDKVRHTVKYDKPDMAPIWFGGESCASNAAAADYCVVMDAIYEDGSGAWNKRAYFSGGTHGWEKSSAVFFPKKPVKRIDLQAVLRKGVGEAKFRDVFFERKAPAKGTVLHEYRRSSRPFAAKDEIVRETFDGTASVASFSAAPERLAATCPLDPRKVVVWTVDSMRCVTPLTFPSKADAAAAGIRLELAGRERESAQICISAGAEAALEGVTVETPLLRAEDDAAFNGDVKWERVGYVPRPATFCAHPFGPPPAEKWVPDPLLPAAPFRVRAASTQGVWLTVAADAMALPGTYHGEVLVRAGARVLASVPLTVRVWGFSLPATFRHRSSFSVMDGFIRKLYPERYAAMRRAAWDMMLDHRLNPDDISRTAPPPVEDLLYARTRGMNLFNVLNLVKPDPSKPWVLCSTPKEIFTADFEKYLRGVLTPYVSELKKNGLFDMAYLYGFDERGKEYYPGLLDQWPRIKKEYGLPLLTTARMYHDLAYGKIETNSPYATMTDWHCPLTQIYRQELTDFLHRHGRQAWWYTCCGPWYPYANMAAFDHPWIEARLIYWMTHKYGMDGFLFWCVNHWGRKCRGVVEESDTYFPEWDAYSVFGTPGDGVLMYPGRDHILGSIRLAEVRDGAEDYEYLAMAADKDPTAVEEIERTLVTSLTEFTRDPAALRAARARLAGILSGE